MVNDTRTWTDAQLRAAVESHTTWKGVASALGLAQSSTPRLKRHAARLGLETSHFTGKRRWSDVDLKSAFAQSSSWSELLERLDVIDASETRRYVKGHAVRLGLDIRRLTGARMVAPTTWESVARSVDVGRYLRFAAESIAIAWFTLRRMPVAIPSEPQPYDLVAWLASGPQRVQVKSGTYRGPYRRRHVRVGQRPYALDATAEAAPYDPSELDYYFILDGDGLIYFIPSGELAGRTTIDVGAYVEYRAGSASSLLERT